MPELHKPVIIDYVMFAEHDVACAVCWQEKAVLRVNQGVFAPCWKCQSEGWMLIKRKKRKWLLN